jgi:hypothetical protein
VLTEAGETFEGGDTTKCPGESNCDDWNSHTGDDDHATKETKVCLGCPMFSSKTSSENEASEIDPQEVEEIVDDIADMIFLANGGHETDWNEYGSRSIACSANGVVPKRTSPNGDHNSHRLF